MTQSLTHYQQFSRSYKQAHLINNKAMKLIIIQYLSNTITSHSSVYTNAR